jgi:SET domain-containing protein
MDGLVVKTVGRIGKGVFTTRPFKKGERVLEFGGTLYSTRALDEAVRRGDKAIIAALARDHFLQVGAKTFLSHSGQADDYVNHSCDPSCGIVIVERTKRVFLFARRPLNAGDAVTFDYATANDRADLEMPCHCGTAKCRSVVRAYEHLPKAVRARYERDGHVASFVLRASARRVSGSR